MMTVITIFLFLTSSMISVLAQCNHTTVTPFFQRSIYSFTLKLVKRINQETESHFVTSALSPWTLLSAISLDASFTTVQEIRELLQLHPRNNCFVHFYLELINQVTTKSNNLALSVLERSSIIFYNASLNIKKSFFNDLSKGRYNFKTTYFGNLIETAISINAHVRKYTHNTIDNIVTPNDVVGISTITIEAMSFRGMWKIPFPYEDIATDAFYNENGHRIGDVSMMYLCGLFNVKTVSQIQATVLELPYYGERYSMLIFLPESNVSLTKILDFMETINISFIFDLHEKPTMITVQIPRFYISSVFSRWKELLMSMGINTIFKQEATNFSDISNYQKFLTNFVQKVKLDVTEDGMEDGRATATMMQSRFLYDQFVANKPFVYMIVDRKLHVPIFTGAYSKPRIY